MTQFISGASSNAIALDVSAADAVRDKIREFSDFEPGWSYGQGIGFDQAVLDAAITLNDEAVEHSFFETDAFPGLHGEVMVTVYHRDHYLEFILEPNGTVTFCREDGDTQVSYREHLSLEEAIDVISEFSEEVWMSSESSTLDTTMIDENAGSSVSHSGALAGTEEFRSSLRSASLNQVQQFADISNATTGEYPTRGRFFGAFQQKYYRRASA